ncbi:MAG: GSCFA domain protein [Bacteroidetes bacterium]|nr:GSCFA domain protein [Bacteroidota bacterium]
MHLTLETELTKSPLIDAYTPLLFVGSCFSENIGNGFQRSGMTVEVNPRGTLYNPVSIVDSIVQAVQKNNYTVEELFQNGELWNSWKAHSSLSSTSPYEVISNLDDADLRVRNILNKENAVLIVTLGTAQVFEFQGSIVGNCHKVAAAKFSNRRLSVEEVVDSLNKLMASLPEKCQVIFTISPVRYVREGLHQSHLSKSVLFLALDEIIAAHSNTHYFPAYEILNDELRDYRFFAEDLVHPGSVAIRIISKKFRDCFGTPELEERIKEWNELEKALNHRILFPETNEAAKFREHTLGKLRKYCRKYNVDLSSLPEDASLISARQ